MIFLALSRSLSSLRLKASSLPLPSSATAEEALELLVLTDSYAPFFFSRNLIISALAASISLFSMASCLSSCSIFFWKAAVVTSSLTALEVFEVLAECRAFRFDCSALTERWRTGAG